MATRLFGGKHMLLFANLFFLFSALALSSTTKASNSTLQVGDAQQYEASKNAYLFEDLTGNTSIHDVISNTQEIRFNKNNSGTINRGLTKSIVWIKIDLQFNDSGINKTRKDWILELARANFEIAELYIVDGTNIIDTQSADGRQPFSNRYLNHSYSHFLIKSRPGHKVTAYLRLKHNTGMYVPITLWGLESFSDHLTKLNFLYGLFYGCLIIITLYNLMLFISTRDTSYLFYVGYLASVTIFEFIILGVHVHFFEDTPRLLEEKQGILAVWSSWFFAFLFTDHYLDLKKQHPVLHRIFISFIVFSVISALFTYLLDYYTAASSTIKISSFFLFIIPATGLYCLAKKSPNAAIFCQAWVLNTGGFLIYAALVTGIFPNNAFTASAMQVGTIAEAITLSLALAQKIKKAEKDKVNSLKIAKKSFFLYKSIFLNAMEGIYSMSLSGEMLSANPSMARTMGYPTTRKLKKDNLQVIKTIFPKNTLRALKTDRQNGIDEEMVISTKTGQTIHIRHRSRFIIGKHGKPTHIEGTIYDVTEQRELEKAQKARLIERYGRELAREENEKQSDFVKQMSFDIRTLLGIIIGYGESLKSHHLAAQEKALFVAIIIDYSNVLLRLINDILDFSKVEAGKMPIEHFPVELFGIIEDIKSKAKSFTREENIAFDIKCEFPLPKVLISDPMRIKQTLEYVGRHCVNCNTEGNISLFVRCDRESNSLIFSFCYSETQAEVKSDTNLQLIIAKKLAELMSGGIEVVSRAGGQTTYNVRIGCGDVKNNEWLTKPPVSVKTTKQEDSKLIPKLSGNILVAEDNVVNQKLIQKVIQRTGANVTLVCDGRQAVDSAIQQEFDLILMDLNMPVMGGIEATSELRSRGFNKPIYALTAEYGQSEIESAIASGCSGHLSKPLDLEKFYAVLQQHLPEDNQKVSDDR